MSKKQLEHDVAKYIVRTARNLEGAPAIEHCPVALVPLLMRDFYGREGEPSAYARFSDLSGALPASTRESCRQRFEELDRLQASLASGDPAVVQTAARVAVPLVFQIASLIESAP